MSAIQEVTSLPAKAAACAYETGAAGLAAPHPAHGGFAWTLAPLLREVDRLQDHSAAVGRRRGIGTPTDEPDLSGATEESSLAFTLIVEIRNKLLEAYQELVRMQV